MPLQVSVFLGEEALSGTLFHFKLSEDFMQHITSINRASAESRYLSPMKTLFKTNLSKIGTLVRAYTARVRYYGPLFI